tara:strand:+ start:2053 stop:2247 length:195 start_codon:yes stop_codon:yes gene_type:complete
MDTNKFNPTAEEVIAELQNSPEGKNQLELAALRVIVAKQQSFIQESDEEFSDTDEDKVSKKGDN